MWPVGRTCKEEFDKHSFFLDYTDRRTFLEPEIGGPSRLYIGYRVCIALYFTAILVYSLVLYFNRWFIYLTHWSLLVLAVDATLQAFVVIRHYHGQKRAARYDRLAEPEDEPKPLTVLLKLIWVLHNITASVAIVVTSMYWSCVYQGEYIGIVGGSEHVANSAYIMIDIFVSGIPFRILHAYQPMLYGLCYLSFLLLYWGLGGTNEHGDNYIYKVVDFEDRAPLACATVLGMELIVLPVAHVILWALYKVRMRIFKSCKVKIETTPV